MATGLTGAQQSLVGTSLQAAIPQAILKAYASEIMVQGLPNMEWFQFAKRKQELSKQKGDTIEMLRYVPLDLGGKLTEGVNIQPKTMSAVPVNLRVDEYGNATQVTERLLQTSAWEQLDIAAGLLADDYAIVMDEYARRAAMSVPSVYFSNGRAARANLVSGDGLTTRTVKKLVEMAKVQKIPKYKFRDPISGAMRMHYVMMITPGAETTLSNETDWKDAYKYQHAQYIFYGEIGIYHGVVFVETTMLPIIKPTSAGATAGHVYIDDRDFSSSAVFPNDPLTVDVAPHATLEVHVCMFMGADLFGYAEALPVEMRDNGVEDYGRKRSLAWYSIFGFGLINPSHGIRVELVTA